MKLGYLIPVLCSYCLFLSCNYTYKIRKGDQAFEVKQYAKAASLYLNEFKNAGTDREKAEKAFKLALCTKYFGDYSQTLKWSRLAYDLNYGSPALYEYAGALKMNGEYEAAADAFKLYGEESGRLQDARKEINVCKLMAEWQNTPSDYIWKVQEIDHLKADGSVYGYQKIDSSAFLYVAERFNSENKTESKFEWSGRPYSKIIYGLTGENLTKSLGNESAYSFEKKSGQLYFTRCDEIVENKQLCKIYQTSLQKGELNKINLVRLPSFEENCIHPAIHHSDSLLVFSSDKPGGSGGWDLYFTTKTDGAWNTPQNLGSRINSSRDEVFPIWNGDSLYYSSNGLVGMGGLDLFKTWKDSLMQWQPPQNLRNPVNSEADDFLYFIDTYHDHREGELMVAYFSSNRDHGLDRVYSATKRLRNIQVAEPVRPKFKFEVQVNIKFTEAISFSDQEKKLLDSVMFIDKVTKHSFSSEYRTSIPLKLTPGLSYRFLITRRGYLNRDIEFSAPLAPILEHDSTLYMNLQYELIPAVMHQEFLLSELYYDFDKWEIRPDAVPALETLKTILITNPKIKVLIGSHTDCRGSQDYNRRLSTLRAQSAANWLIQSGIPETRIKYQGFGASKPAIVCQCDQCTDQQHQNNRRSTFQLIP